MPSFAARHYLRAMLWMIVAMATLGALFTIDRWKKTEIGEFLGLWVVPLVILAFALVRAAGEIAIYHLFAAGAVPPGKRITLNEFRGYLLAPRPCILYLRNFSSEGGVGGHHTVPKDSEILRGRFVPETSSNLEEVIYQDLRANAKLLALENYSSNVIPYFDTVFFSDGEWRDAVRFALKNSSVVILAVESLRSGVLEEADMIVALAADKCWFIASEAVLVSQAGPLQVLAERARWVTRIPRHHSFRSLKRFDVPADLVNFLVPVGAPNQHG